MRKMYLYTTKMNFNMMRKILLLYGVLGLVMSVQAQVLLVRSGNVTYTYSASETGEMMFEGGQRLTILGKEFVLSEVDEMQVDGTPETDVQVRQAQGETIVRISETPSADSIGAYTNSTNNVLWSSSLSGLRLRFDSARVTHVEIESVDGYCIAGTDTADIVMHDIYTPYRTPDKFSIVTYTADGTFTPGKDYYVPLFPTDLYGGYRLSIFKDGLVAHYFGVHQRAEAGTFITPPDLHEDQLEFDDPNAPLVEDERPGLNEETKQALAAYKHNPTEANKQALLDINTSHTYMAGQDNLPVVNISYTQAEAYCAWLSTNDTQHDYRLPTEEEWILAAGHMPKDVVMNTNHVELGLTAVDAYSQTTGACGGIDFWGNCWEWTSTTNESGQYIVKGGAWDTSRDECRTEYSEDARNGAQGYANVGFRVVRVDK